MWWKTCEWASSTNTTDHQSDTHSKKCFFLWNFNQMSSSISYQITLEIDKYTHQICYTHRWNLICSLFIYSSIAVNIVDIRAFQFRTMHHLLRKYLNTRWISIPLDELFARRMSILCTCVLMKRVQSGILFVKRWRMISQCFFAIWCEGIKFQFTQHNHVFIYRIWQHLCEWVNELK